MQKTELKLPHFCLWFFADKSITYEQSSRIQCTCRTELHMWSNPEMLLGQNFQKEKKKKSLQLYKTGRHGTLLNMPYGKRLYGSTWGVGV